MIRRCLEFLLSRSRDTKQPLSPWLQRLVQRDPQLQQFDCETRQLDDLLRRSASAHREAMVAESSLADADLLTLPPQRATIDSASTAVGSRLSATWFTGLAVAAVLLLVIAPNLLRPSAPEVHAGEFSQQFTVVPGKVLQLITSATETSTTRLPQISPLANLSVPKLPSWESFAQQLEQPLQQEANLWQDSWQNLKSQLPESTPDS